MKKNVDTKLMQPRLFLPYFSFLYNFTPEGKIARKCSR